VLQARNCGKVAVKGGLATKLFSNVTRFLCSVPFVTITSTITRSFSASAKLDLTEQCEILGFA
jgi:hypothetical protein